MEKQRLRKRYRQKRMALHSQEIATLQNRIYQQVFKRDFSSEETIHVFLPIERHKEINTYPIISFLRNIDKTIVVSKTHFKDNRLNHFILEEHTLIQTNKWGISEPVNAQSISEKEIDLVFVPMLISDQKNYRVGYGKGFYDRFLSNCKPTVTTIGLNFFPPIDNIKDIDQYDVPLDVVIYPKGLLTKPSL